VLFGENLESPVTRSLVETNVDHYYPIWLLGDSPSDSPSAKGQNLTPLDSRHPTRHTIWTPILDVIQRHLFVESGRRLDDRELFVRNAVSNSDHKWEKLVDRKTQIDELRERLNGRNKPLLVLCFGQFAFEFARWAQGEQNKRPLQWKKWTVPELRKQFDLRIGEFQLGSVTLLPLLHQYVALQFSKSHARFSGEGSNYFEYVGKEIANKVLIDKVLKANHTDDRLSKLWLPKNSNGAASD
jgi:hypothetical protein